MSLKVRSGINKKEIIMNKLRKLLLVGCVFIFQGCAVLPYIQDVLDETDVTDVLDDADETDVTNVVGEVPSWDKATKASCWSGSNAEQRNMNILSPNMSDDIFKDRVAWQINRGCNTVHLYLSNKADGEYAGYCIYGNSWDWTIDESFVKTFKNRILYCRAKDLAVVVWLFADDSGSWNAEAAKNFTQYLQDLKEQGLFDQASTVVSGLELNEYFSSRDIEIQTKQVMDLVASIRNVYSGKIGTHGTSEFLSYASLGDIVFYQVSPGKSASWIKAEAERVISVTGKPVNFFELSRQEDRTLSSAALEGKCFGVGNW